MCIRDSARAARRPGVLHALRRAHPHAHHRGHPAARGLQHVGLAQLRAPVQDGLARRGGHAAAHLRAHRRVRPGGGHRRGHADHGRPVHEDRERGDRGARLEVLLRRGFRGHAPARAARERARVRDQRPDVLRHDLSLIHICYRSASLASFPGSRRSAHSRAFTPLHSACHWASTSWSTRRPSSVVR